MNLDRRFRLVLILNVLISMFGFGVANDILPLLLPVFALAVTGWWVTEVRASGRGWRGLPRWLSNSILLVMLAFAILRAIATNDLVQGFTEFLIAILVIKLWERRSLRDYGQLLTLSLFMSVGATLATSGFMIALVWAVHLPLLVAGVMMFQVFAGRARASGTRAAAGLPVTGLTLNRPAFYRLWLAVLAISMLVSGTVFVLVPRGMGIDQFGAFSTGTERRVGFTEVVDPGEGSLISTSYSTVFEVKFSNADGPIGALGQSFYMRGAVLDDYGHGANRWTALGAPRNDADGSHGNWITISPQKLDYIEQRVTVLANSRQEAPMFSVFRPFAVRLERSVTPHRVSFDRATGRLTRRGERGGFTYTVRSAQPEPEPGVVIRRDAEPYPSERVNEFARQIIRDAGLDPDPATRPLEEDLRVAETFQRYLRSNFIYATDQLKAPVSASDDPTYWFLSEARRGHCEYFATGLAALCRSVGINARVVAGYLVSEYDPDRGVYTARESDAHAWTEVDAGPAGWVVMDATPAADGQLVEDDGPFHRLRRLYASASDFWNNNIATFGQREQERLLGPLGMTRAVDESVEWYRRKRGQFRRMIRQMDSPVRSALWAGGAVLAVGAAWAAARAWKRRPTHVVEFGWAMRGAEQRVYKDLVKHLAARGHPKPAWSPPLVHLRRIAHDDPALARHATRVMDLLYDARFGDNHASIREAQRRLTELQSEVS